MEATEKEREPGNITKKNRAEKNRKASSTTRKLRWGASRQTANIYFYHGRRLTQVWTEKIYQASNLGLEKCILARLSKITTLSHFTLPLGCLLVQVLKRQLALCKKKKKKL